MDIFSDGIPVLLYELQHTGEFGRTAVGRGDFNTVDFHLWKKIIREIRYGSVWCARQSRVPYTLKYQNITGRYTLK